MKKREDYNGYMRVYMLARYHRRMEEAREVLGGKCVSCGTRRDLELDHIDRSTKKFTIGKLWSVSKKKFWEEVAKCQLLCRVCHEVKEYSHTR